ncbi:MAG TPA: EAL domain-containing protein [Steroidobacteraceae bacterium]|nr:EAL domain-containing protein [Steroidobacteraceae bacterium]
MPATTSSPRAPFIRAGIGLRLALAFAIVGILAAASNYIAERGASIVQTSWVVPPTLAWRPPPVAAVAPPAAKVIAAAPLPLSGELLAAVAQYERAVHIRLSTPSESREEEIEAARLQMSQRSREFAAAAAPTATDARRRALTVAMRSFEKVGADAVTLADQRHLAYVEYVERFDALHGRLKTALDRAMKLFGRVIARQYMVKLRDSLDELRRDSATLSSRDYTVDDVAAIAAAESAFGKLLEQNAARLAGSQGKEWPVLVQGDFGRVTTLRESILRLDAEQATTQEQLRTSVTALEQRIRDVAAVRSKRAPAPIPAVGVLAAKVEPPAAVAPPAPAVVVERPAVKSDVRALIRWISVAVLAVLLLIGVATVRSIVLPVRKLLEATARLAAGDAEVRVTRGGIKELDTLAVAFNQMAEQIVAGREQSRGYQQELEQRVEERTRQLLHQAEHDPLTLLPNRRQLFSLLDRALVEAARDRTMLGVFFLDLDNFKNINDGMGHAFGDRALVAIADRLRETAAPYGFAARFGGDEFTVVHVGAASVEAICATGRSLVQAFQKPLPVDGRELLVSVSVGASLYPDHHDTADALLRDADTALFRAKALGRSQLALFTPELLQAAAERFSTEQGVRHAVERGEFELVFQPEVHTGSFESGVVEALLRWRLPDGRLALPGEFLGVAEESGLIMEISDWVLRSAIEAAAGWHHGDWPQARVAINVSSRQLFDLRFVDNVLRLLEEYRLPARCIEIELTETVLQTGPATLESLRRLRAHGVAIALDDFGTGYSTLASLEQLPITRVKLDRSLIAGIDTSPRSAAIANAIIGLCGDLGLEITAEGIERREQFAALLLHKPLFMQGFLIATPVAQQDVLSVIAEIPQRMQSLLLATPVVTSANVSHLELARRRQAL